MINYNYETDALLTHEVKKTEWIISAITQENFTLGELNYIFCNDEYLHKINIQYLNHDTLTDVISFDYTEGKCISGDIYISVERVKENATNYDVSFDSELCRVMLHGVLHFCGYDDKSEKEKEAMRSKEDFYLKQLN